LEGPSGTTEVFGVTSGSRGWTTESLDLSSYTDDADSVTMRVEATGDATVRVDAISMTTDSDGDGLIDEAEEAAEDMPPVPLVRIVGEERRIQERYVTLDTYDDDVDEDGLEDGDEIDLDTRPVGGEQWYHTEERVVEGRDVTAHPNLANTDGMGLADPTEVEKGSAPTVPERVAVGFRVPTVAEESGGEWQPKDQGGGEYRLSMTDVYTPALHDDGLFSDPTPNWLEEIGIEEGDEDKKYLLVKAYIFVTRSGNTQADYRLPTHGGIRLPENSNAEVIGHTGQQALHQGVKVFNLVIEVPRGGQAVQYGDLGSFELGLYTPDDSPFHREASGQRGERDAGDFVYVKTHDYQYQDYGQYDANHMVQQAAEEFKEGMAKSMFVYETAYGALLAIKMGQSATREIIESVAKEVAKDVVKPRERAIEYVASLRSQDSFERGNVQTREIEAGVVEYQERFVYAGPVIVRNN
jgi:hypothetical protein